MKHTVIRVILPIENYSFKRRDNIFLDANIWLVNYMPTYERTVRLTTYSSALEEMYKMSCTIYTHVIVVSEFINAYSRREHKANNPEVSYKEFRESSEGKKIAAEISKAAQSILKRCELVGAEPDKDELMKQIELYGEGNKDFNDQIIAELCKTENLKLITHDGDFATSGVPVVITGNNKLLKTGDS